MLDSNSRLALFAPKCLTTSRAKMAHGILRFSNHKVVCAIDPDSDGTTGTLIPGLKHDVPVVPNLESSRAAGANVLVLGIAPLGGRVPDDWWPLLQHALDLGFSLANGLHQPLSHELEIPDGQWIWDIRTEPEDLPTATGRAAALNCRRILTIGTDMSVGKMTTGLLMHQALLDAGHHSAFVATGQIGISIMGEGVPLDAIRLDFAAGAIEQAVCQHAQAGAEFIIVEGQGSLLHPSSTAPLPLLRGTCPTDLVLCHRAGLPHLKDFQDILIPPLEDVVELYQQLASTLGLYAPPALAGFAVNTLLLENDAQARMMVTMMQAHHSVPCTDPVRFGIEPLVSQLLQSQT